MRTVDAIVSDMVMTHPIRIRRAANVVGHGASRCINRVRAKVRRVPFERGAHFRVGACPRIIRGERRAIDSHHMPGHVSAGVIEELTHDKLAQRIPCFAGRCARLEAHEPPRANEIGYGICIHVRTLFSDRPKMAAEFSYAPVRRKLKVVSAFMTSPFVRR